MGKSQRDKGARAEREIAKILDGERIPLSGAMGSYKGDITAPYLGTGEVKVRGNGFKKIYEWLGENDFLAIKADRKKWLVCIPATDIRELINELDELKRGGGSGQS